MLLQCYKTPEALLRASDITPPNVLSTNIVPQSWNINPQLWKSRSFKCLVNESWEAGFELRSVSF